MNCDIDSAVLRVVDANGNRAREGLRVVEEVARFIHDNKELAHRVKELRLKVTEVLRNAAVEHEALESARDSENDIGRDVELVSEFSREGIADVVRANFGRVQESLRVLEEFGKLLGWNMARECKKMRYEAYTLEKDYTKAFFA